MVLTSAEGGASKEGEWRINMGDKTKISWTDATINPFIGCSRIASGCKNCYAEALAPRLARMGCERYEGLTKRTDNGTRWTGETKFVPSELLKPLRWTRPRRIFVTSMGDTFHEGNTDEEIIKVFAMMALSPQHQFYCQNALKIFCYLLS